VSRRFSLPCPAARRDFLCAFCASLRPSPPDLHGFRTRSALRAGRLSRHRLPRVAFLLSEGVKPWEIPLLAFTNKPADEMFHRVQDPHRDLGLQGVPRTDEICSASGKGGERSRRLSPPATAGQFICPAGQPKAASEPEFFGRHRDPAQNRKNAPPCRTGGLTMARARATVRAS